MLGLLFLFYFNNNVLVKLYLCGAANDWAGYTIYQLILRLLPGLFALTLADEDFVYVHML